MFLNGKLLDAGTVVQINTVKIAAGFGSSTSFGPISEMVIVGFFDDQVPPVHVCLPITKEVLVNLREVLDVAESLLKKHKTRGINN